MRFEPFRVPLKASTWSGDLEMAHINIEFTLFSAFYSPLISLMSGGFLQAEGLEAD
jgi:hypothetical protein